MGEGEAPAVIAPSVMVKKVLELGPMKGVTVLGLRVSLTWICASEVVTMSGIAHKE
jgi:hypothetical protein